MFVLEYLLGHKQTVGIPAHRGVAVEDGVTAGLQHLILSMDACIEVALRKYDELTALSADPRREKYRENVPYMVTTALAELRQYGAPSETQGAVQWHAEGLRLPLYGIYDYYWRNHGIIADLKTTEKMPAEIKRSHARQVALYSPSDNYDARLIYVTPKKLEAYKLENIGEHRRSLARIAKTIENFLELSDDPNYFVTITMPDIDSFYWKEPAARQLAYQYWGV